MVRDTSHSDSYTPNRRDVIMAIGAGSTVALAGCSGDGDGNGNGNGSGNGNGNGGGGDEVTYLQFAEGANWDYAADEIIPAHEEESEVSVDESNLPTEEYKASLTSYLGTNNAPDLFMMWSGPGRAGELVATDRVIELSESGVVSDEVLEEFQPGLYAYQFEDGNPTGFTKGDSIYGVSRDMGGYPIWFNEVVLDEAGVDPDDYRHRKDVTIEEFENLMAQVEENTDKGVIAAGNGDGGKNAYWGALLMMKAGGHQKFIDACLGANDEKLTDQVFVDALGRLKTWYDNGWIIEDTLSLQEHPANGLFFENDAAFICDGSWAQAEYDEYADPDELAGMGEEGGWDYFWFPIFPDMEEESEVRGAVNMSGFQISKSAEERGLVDETVELMESFLSTEHLQRNLDDTMVIPFTSETDQFDWPNPAIEQMAVDIAEAEAIVEKADRMLLPAAADAFYSESVNLYLDGTAEEVLQATQEATEQNLEEYNS